MDEELDYFLSAAILLFGLVAFAAAAWIDHRRAGGAMPGLVPMGPIMLLGTLAVLASIVHFLNTLHSGDSSYYYIAAAMLVYGVAVGAMTVLVEHRRRRNPQPRLASTTPFLILAAIVVLASIALLVSVLQDAPPTFSGSWRLMLIQGRSGAR
jgi:peptidoglycan/LPS O-acetylase OafA/YrhL